MKRIIWLVVLIVLASQLAVSAQAPGSRNLFWGSQGEDVRQVQLRLIRWGYLDASATGNYGPQTYNAVRLFQQRNGLPQTGNVDAATFRALGFNPRMGAAPAARPASPQVDRTPATQSTGALSPNDMTLLARAVYSEARGEPFEGQVAVAAVVLNRLRSPLFPNTISGVIFEPLAFTAVADGQFWLEPDENAYRAAQMALDGWDPSGGALYYFNPRTATSQWIWSRPYIKTIGKHRFLR